MRFRNKLNTGKRRFGNGRDAIRAQIEALHSGGQIQFCRRDGGDWIIRQIQIGQLIKLRQIGGDRRQQIPAEVERIDGRRRWNIGDNCSHHHVGEILICTRNRKRRRPPGRRLATARSN